MQVLIDTNRVVTTYGILSDPAAIELAESEVPKLAQRGVKTLQADGTLVVRLDPAIDAKATADAAASADMRARMVLQAQSAVGVRLDALTPLQVRALMGCLLHRAGGVHSDMTVAPLGEWMG